MEEKTKAFEYLVTHLNYRWKLHADLFMAGETQLLNQSGSNVWVVLQNSLLDSIFMDISRLLDPPTSFSKDNLSIERLLQSVTQTKDATDLDTQLQKAKDIFGRLIRPWRNQRLSHNDLSTTTGTSTLPDVPFCDLGQLIDHINEAARIIISSCTSYNVDFIPAVTPCAWTERLLSVLHEGVNALSARSSITDVDEEEIPQNPIN